MNIDDLIPQIPEFDASTFVPDITLEIRDGVLFLDKDKIRVADLQDALKMSKKERLRIIGDDSIDDPLFLLKVLDSTKETNLKKVYFTFPDGSGTLEY